MRRDRPEIDDVDFFLFREIDEHEADAAEPAEPVAETWAGALAWAAARRGPRRGSVGSAARRAAANSKCKKRGASGLVPAWVKAVAAA